MRIPAPGEVRSQPPRAFQIVLLHEELADHGRNLANLHMLEAQLTVQTFRSRLGLGRRELMASRRSENAPLLVGGVDPQSLVEVADSLASRSDIARLYGSQESPEEVVQVAVFARQRLTKGTAATADLHPFDFFTLSDRERMIRLSLIFRRIPPVLATALLFTTACREERDPVRRTLDGIVKAAQERDAEGVAASLTPDFRDEEGEDAAGVAAILRRYFSAYESIDVKVRDLEIERAPESARARFVADISGRPRRLAGIERFFPSSATYRFDLRLVPEAGRWRVAWASWEVAGDGR